jgi:hypothetical protein
MADRFKTIQRIGPGGYKCFCCGPTTPKKRTLNRRITRHRLKQENQKEILAQIKEMDEERDEILKYFEGIFEC